MLLKTTEKIRGFDELVTELDANRNGHRVVHCHGVFDLLHPGHIRHLQAAKRLGDVLVVTLTPDRFVNKGPNRPAFTEQLRAESLAALDCVDYVAINKWPMAVQTIIRLRPNLYVKGGEYRQSECDHTGAILAEEQAVNEAGGQLVFTDEIVFSSSSLINEHLGLFPEATRRYLKDFNLRHGFEAVQRTLRHVAGLNVLTVGEAIIDEYLYCQAMGKSSKEPMLAVKHNSTETFAGGILAATNHVAGFAKATAVVSVLGTQQSHEPFIRAHLAEGVEAAFVMRPDAPTIVKRRVVDSYFFQKLFEIYEMNDEPLAGPAEAELLRALGKRMSDADAVIALDFGHGMMTPAVVELLCGKAKFLAVNAQSNAGNLGYHTISKYPRADLVCVAENEMRLEARDRGGDLRPIVQDVANRLKCDRVIVTRGAHGCLCYAKDEGFFEVPALAGQVVDRMGAGDSFLAIAAPCVAAGAPIEVAGFIGSAASAQKVACVGHRRNIEKPALLKQIECLLK